MERKRKEKENLVEPELSISAHLPFPTALAHSIHPPRGARVLHSIGILNYRFLCYQAYFYK
jgi:hypothetical protein